MYVHCKEDFGEPVDMSLEYFLAWCLQGARATYEVDLMPDDPPWEEVPAEGKLEGLAHEIRSLEGSVEFCLGEMVLDKGSSPAQNGENE